VGPRAGLDDVENRKFLTLPGLNCDPSVVQPVASRYTDYATPAHMLKMCSPIVETESSKQQQPLFTVRLGREHCTSFGLAVPGWKPGTVHVLRVLLC
jgi:hypothetical protein